MDIFLQVAEATMKRRRKQKYVITSISSSDIDFKFLDALLNYCKLNKAKLQIYPTKNFEKNSTQEFRKEMEKYLVTSDKQLNLNLKTVTSLNQSEFVSDIASGIISSESLIIPAITQRMKCQARQVAHNHLPIIIQGTGSINRIPTEYSKKSEFKAIQNWIVGGIIVEVVDDKKFHMRNIEFDGKGFQDLATYYGPRSAKKVNAAGMLAGDLHPMEECEETLEATKRLIKEVGVQELAVGDWLNAGSISHHEENNRIGKALNNVSLREEGEYAAKLINDLSKLVKKMILVDSNHPQHVRQWLTEKNRTVAPENAFLYGLLTCAALWTPDSQKTNPEYEMMFKKVTYLKNEEKYKIGNVKVGTMKDGGMNVAEFLLKCFEPLENCIFLSETDEYRIADKKINRHGHKGQNGARNGASSATKDEAQGHTHSTEITKNGAYIVGTMTKLLLGYTDGTGVSTWLNSHALIFKNGKRQMIHIIKGQYRS